RQRGGGGLGAGGHHRTLARFRVRRSRRRGSRRRDRVMSVLSGGALASRQGRIDRVRGRMGELGVDVLLLSHGADLPWLTGYRAMPLERLTVLVLPRDGEAVLVVPALEAPRVPEEPGAFSLRPWAETEDPVKIAVELIGGRTGTLGVSDRAWATSLLAFQ